MLAITQTYMKVTKIKVAKRGTPKNIEKKSFFQKQFWHCFDVTKPSYKITFPIVDRAGCSLR